MQCTQNINQNIEFVNIHFLEMDFLLIFSKEPSEFATFCTKFESNPSIEHQEIKKIRWVRHNRPGPLESRNRILVELIAEHIIKLK